MSIALRLGPPGRETRATSSKRGLSIVRSRIGRPGIRQCGDLRRFGLSTSERRIVYTGEMLWLAGSCVSACPPFCGRCECRVWGALRSSSTNLCNRDARAQVVSRAHPLGRGVGGLTLSLRPSTKLWTRRAEANKIADQPYSVLMAQPNLTFRTVLRRGSSARRQ